MGDHPAAAIDHYRLAVVADPAVIRKPLHLRKVNRPGEEADQVALGIQHGYRDHNGGHTGIAAGSDHVGILRTHPPGVQDVLDVVPDAVIDAHAGGRGGGHRASDPVADVEL